MTIPKIISYDYKTSMNQSLGIQDRPFAFNTSAFKANSKSSNVKSNSKSETSGLNKYLTENAGYIMVILAGIILLVLIIVFIVYLIKKSSKEGSLVVSTPIRMDGPSIPMTVSSRNIVSTVNGQEYTFSFWIYLSENYESTSMPKLLFRRGGDATKMAVSDSPVVYMGETSNKMTIIIPTTLTNVSDDVTLNSLSSAKVLKAEVNYVPLQRWVHFAFCIQDGVLMVYMDGELYTVRTIADITLSSSESAPIIRGTTGDMFIGDAVYKTRGFITKVEFFNYMMSQSEMQNLYRNGPSASNTLAKLLGLASYGFRAPIYRIDQDTCSQ